jgi:putative membrane protein
LPRQPGPINTAFALSCTMFVPKSLLALAPLLLAGHVPASQAASPAHQGHAVHAAARRISVPDWQFMRRAAAFGQAAIAAGRLADAHAADPAVRDFGTVLAAEHLELNQRLGLLSLLKHVPLPPAAPEDQRKSLAALKQLAGTRFDGAFVERMTTLEDQLVRLFQAEADSRAADPALRSFAGEYVPKLEAEEHLLQDLHSHASPPAAAAASPG